MYTWVNWFPTWFSSRFLWVVVQLSQFCYTNGDDMGAYRYLYVHNGRKIFSSYLVQLMVSYLFYMKGDDFLILYLWFQVRNNKSILRSICNDFLFNVWCPCLLAHTIVLLDSSACPYDETPNHAHDKVQVYPIQHWKAGELSSFKYIF